MAKLSVLYGHPTDSTAFESYYAETHIPLALKIPGMLRIEAAKVGPTPDGQQPVYYRTADRWFATLIAEVTAAQGHL